MRGEVGNDSEGVHIELDGDGADVAAFLTALRDEAPPLAEIDTVDVTEYTDHTGHTDGAGGADGAGSAEPGGGFRIVASDPARDGGGPRTQVCADSATCANCLRELADPADRRYQYPFINCTNCGPRFTIILDVPYDRPATTMAPFRMCGRCRAEYEDPTDRRFHAQPVCCPDCGPTLEFRPAHGFWLTPDFRLGPGFRLGAGIRPTTRPGQAPSDNALNQAAALLRAGGILAVKGLGGYHLAVLATDDKAVAELRRRKRRDGKPFALMARDLAEVERLCVVDETARRLLTGRRRPIVLLDRRPAPPDPPAPPDASDLPDGAGTSPCIAPSVAPGVRTLGIMLPYTPLHHLLLGRLPGPIVLTSGNISDEPILFRDDEALAGLGRVADGFLLHDRAIHTRLDDSVTRSVRGRAAVVRRSRGYAPEPVPLAWDVARPVLACGAELKNTVCLAAGRRAYLSGHLGDLENPATLRSFAGAIEHLGRLFDIRPELVAHDLHPEYLSTKWALEQELPVVGVQHHHAHIASCLADNGQRGPVLGVAFDGLGFGLDGTLWGGEFLWADLTGFTRVAHFEPVALPGGAAAIRAPWRMAAAYLQAAGVDHVERLGVARRNEAWWDAVTSLARACSATSPATPSALATPDTPPTPTPLAPRTSSVGRLFDAVAALVGVRDTIRYEGQAAIELEQLAAPGDHGAYPSGAGRGALARGTRVGGAPGTDALVLSGAGLVRDVVADLRAGATPEVVAARFHTTLARLTVDTCVALRERLFGTEPGTVALSGGVFANVRLAGEIEDGLARSGFTVLTHARVPCNDGGISLGQAAVASARSQENQSDSPAPSFADTASTRTDGLT
ncbi:carbamoyltransferase HypF [Frankia sp. CcI49]|uniref:carbamoyltransferase HypF n=1 Tax=Frankia sp. CcI49 TaxID=1745382 RepID=UPI0009CE73B5|nr:carbamoyltransferase HypF [Frankia sp. CcI49]ONH54062.1 carbamoyltransferase HypF [Frankia sp. CcI49]